MAEDEPVDQITDLLSGIDNLCLDVLHTQFRDMALQNSIGVKTEG